MSAAAPVISVIGPHREEVEAVAGALRDRVPAYRIVVDAGPDVADGVIAVAGSVSSTDGPDAAIVRAVRDAMGGCILYTGDAGDLADEPGVTVVTWGAVTGRTDLGHLADVVASRWIDVPRWLSDIRRADADRIDRVRVAVRLTAEKHAGDLLEPGAGVHAGACPGDAAEAAGRARLDALFRARLRCTVLEHGVEWPHLPEPVEPAGLGGERRDPADPARRQRALLLVAASLGAGFAAAVGVGRLAGPSAGIVAGLVVAVLLALVRHRMLAGARREQERARGAARLRREWAAVATEVVSRLRIPSVAESVLIEVAR